MVRKSWCKPKYNPRQYPILIACYASNKGVFVETRDWGSYIVRRSIVGGLDWCWFAPVTTLRYQKSAVNLTGKKLALLEEVY
jgi:hypothetical protein